VQYVGSRSVYCLNKKVYSCVLKVSTETSVDHSATGRLFHIDGSQTAKLLSPSNVLVGGTDSRHRLADHK